MSRAAAIGRAQRDQENRVVTGVRVGRGGTSGGSASDGASTTGAGNPTDNVDLNFSDPSGDQDGGESAVAFGFTGSQLGGVGLGLGALIGLLIYLTA